MAIQHDYVDDVKAEDIIHGALKGMLAALDPYSQYMDQDMFTELQVETEGEFGGLGIEITLRDDLLTIITPLSGTPAEKAGLQSQDRIVKIDDEITRDMTLLDAVKKMRGKKGTDVKLTIMRESEESLREVTLTRDIIKIKSVRKAEMLSDGIGYIRLADFSEKTHNDLEQALSRLSEQGMEGLVFDLRNNPGGLLLTSVDVAAKFLPAGTLVVYTKGREESQNVEYRAQGKSDYRDIPLIVMVNGGSASASEIVAGAVQDHKRGIIMGTKSFGKGSVQTVIPLRDGSALRLTTAKYYTPSGRTINETGIVPDVPVEQLPPQPETAKKPNGADEIFNSITEEENNSEITVPEDSGVQPEAAPEDNEKETPETNSGEETAEINELLKNDYQLRAAVDLMRGIRIYKGLSQKAPKD